VNKVLVIDDDPGIRESLRDVLCGEGYEVVTAENGRVGLERLRTRPCPDAVILDLMMPVLSGWEVLEVVAADPSLMSIPILVVSAMAAPIDAGRARGGVRMSLSKPIDVGALVDGLDDLTRTRTLEGTTMDLGGT
jgi:CheY-like chemotaxis protein